MRTVFFLLLTSILLGSCATLYTPSAQNVPLISSKGESSITLTGDGQVEDGAQLDFQVAYGLTDKIALASNVTWVNQADRYVSNDVMQGGYFFLGQAGAGYFKQIKQHYVFETYGLIGLGEVENRQFQNPDPSDLDATFITSNLIKAGIQPNIGYKRKYWSIAISSGFYYLRYFNIEGDLILDDTNYNAYLATNSTHLLIEPSLTVKAGFKNIQLQCQSVASINVFTLDFPQRNDLVTFGISWNFNPWMKKQKANSSSY